MDNNTGHTPAPDGAHARQNGHFEDEKMTPDEGEALITPFDGVHARRLPRLSPKKSAPAVRRYDAMFPVQFDDDILILADHEGTPHVIMRPVTENLGLDWKSQHAKLVDKFASTVVIITTVAEDGKQREMVSLPLRKFPAWLYSLTPAKVAPGLREKIVRYQEECDEVLWQYWTTGVVARPGINVPTIPQQISLFGLRIRLVDRLEKEGHPVKRRMIHEQIDAVSRMLNQPCPELDSLGAAVEQPRLEGV